MHPISVCIIAKNEETRIEQCLKSIKPCGFEIVVVDTVPQTGRRKSPPDMRINCLILHGVTISPPPEIFPFGRPPTTGSL